MKTPQHRATRRGFTLIELMTTIAIIAVLAGMMIAAVGYARNTSNRSKAAAHLKAIRSGLESYKRDYGSFPEPTTPNGKMVEVNGTQWEGMGAAVIYQALSGDGDDLIKGGGSGSIGQPKSAENTLLYWDGADFTSNIHKAVSKRDGAYYMIDPWGIPWQYAILPSDQRNNQEAARQFRNPAIYDMYSYGTAKEDWQDQKKWITNW